LFTCCFTHIVSPCSSDLCCYRWSCDPARPKVRPPEERGRHLLAVCRRANVGSAAAAKGGFGRFGIATGRTRLLGTGHTGILS
jgi:hypothetical protein